MASDQNQTVPEPSSLALPEFPNWFCLSCMAGFCLAIFGKVLFISPREVLSDPNFDLNFYFIHRRFFGFHELSHGNLPLWNPHCASGTPFFGNFEPALLYPLNFLYLLLPLEAAINWTIALHVFLGGAFTFYWVRNRGLHSLAGLLAAFMFMCCGPHFLQIQVGHLSNLATLIWAPLLFLAIDKMVDRPSLGAGLFGMFVVAMAVLAGHPQYVFYMGVAAGIYSILNVLDLPQKGRVVLGLAAMALGGFALSAVQLFTGLQEGRGSIRSLGTSYQFASSYSFPPENLLTLIAPWCFGDMQHVPYWGRWYLSEVSLFVSVMGLALAVYGLAQGDPKLRRFSGTMLIATLVLALGCYTPLFPLLFNYVPGFNMFRGMDKFLLLAALFLSMLAAIGMDRLLRQQKIPWWLVIGVGGLGFIFCLLATLPTQLDWWAGLLQSLLTSGSTTMLQATFSDPHLVLNTSTQASLSLVRGGITLLVAAALLELAKSRRNLACWAILLLAGFELTSFAGASLVTFKPGSYYAPPVAELLNSHPGDYRIEHNNPNAAMSAGYLDIAGDDPTGLLRYQRFMNFAWGLDVDNPPLGLTAKKLDTNALRMVRLRFAFSKDDHEAWEFGDGLPHFSVVNHFRVMTNWHDILFTLTNANFDMNKEIMLESQPVPPPQPATQKAEVKLLASSTDYLELETDVAVPSLLFITDAYSSGWRALPLPGSSQAQYQIMPANYCLQAVPLQAGHHHLRLEYSPLGFRVGRIVSLTSLAVFLLLLAWVVKNHTSRASAGAVPS